MSYASLDVSQQSSDPVLLFQFVRGATTWRYVALPVAFTAMGYTWQPEVIGAPGGFRSAGDVPKDAISITLPITNAMAAAFLAYAPDDMTTVTVFRTHYSDPTNGVALWKGRVLRSPTSVATVSLDCENVFTSLRRMGLRQVYSRKCRHMLYGPGCNVDRTNFDATVTILAVVGNVVTIQGTSGGYAGGTLKAPDGTLRRIVSTNSNGSVFTLMRAVPSLITEMAAHPTGFSATVYLGCDNSTTTCRDVFHNLGNHGGFPGINGVTPMNGSINAF
jgi:uncharacterized phage protein (TIGR02218 family)